MNKKAVINSLVSVAILLAVFFTVGIGRSGQDNHYSIEKAVNMADQFTSQENCQSLESEEHISVDYCIKNEKVYFNDGKLGLRKISDRGKDAKLQDNNVDFLNDEKNIYFEGRILKRVNPETFLILKDAGRYFIAKDKKSTYVIMYDWYHDSVLIFPKDSDAFEILPGDRIRNSEGVFKIVNTNSTKTGLVFDVIPLKVDKKTFTTIITGASSSYTKDKNGIYFNDIKIPEADLGSFKVFTEGIEDIAYYTQYNYAKDNNNVYYRGNILKEADTKSFDIVVNNKFSHVYAKDNKNVYLKDKVIPLADILTFKAFSDGWQGGGYSYYSADKNYVFYELNVIEGADPKTFEQLDCSWGRDSKHVYIEGRLDKDLNPENFEPFCGMG